ncbi:MAG: type VI secretion system tube protein Hcp [Alphaproteobacteria bacterium]|nr:type VI secretion system tube protein Hcp [Alphaproteobacteria bacterium]
MADDNQSPTDLLMMFVSPGGSMGESLTHLNPSDQLASDFKPGKFFELKSFELDFDLSDSAQGGGSSKSGGRTGKTPTVIVNVPQGGQGSGHGAGGGGGGAGGSGQEFSGWLSTGMTDTLALKVKACKVTRLIDMASPWLFNMCTRKRTMSKAIIVARRSGGDSRGPLTFFKLEFEQVILSSLNWAFEDAMVTEQLEFFYRKLTAQYAKQTASGRHENVKTGQWEWSQELASSDG